MSQDFYAKLVSLLKKNTNFLDKQGELLKHNAIDAAYKGDKKLIEILLEDKDTKEKFFSKINNVLIFNVNDFVAYIQDKNFLADSYTKYRNKIGLNIDGKFLNERKEVALVWPFKDCVLEGGMTKEDEKRKEVFFNEILAQDEIDELLTPKVLINWKRYSKNGDTPLYHASESGNPVLKRDENGVIRENLIIKGNNLLALHSLKTQFQNKVKLIYIDPPYNTGNDSFGYNDNFNHSTWLTFMKNRLEVARELLRDDGVIFISCDDNEQAYLKVLMDEIFGEENFDSVITTIVKTEGRRYGNLAKTHEYILVFAKNIFTCQMFELEVENKHFSYEDDKGGYDLKELRNQNTFAFNSKNRPNLRYAFYVDEKNQNNNGFNKVFIDKKSGLTEVWPIKISGNESVWRWGKQKSKEEIENNNLTARKGSDGIFRIYQKYRSSTTMAKTVWTDKDFISNKGTKEIQALFGKTVFLFPKPEKLIKRIIDISTRQGDIILDYHIGSGTTAAVAHKMNRQYIGIEQMEYVEKTVIERLKNVIKGEQGGISKAVNWKGGSDFIYCELMKYNELFVDKIKKASSSSELLKIWEGMKAKSFLNYNIDIKKFDETIDEFKKLPFAKQQRILFDLLNKNQLYVNLSEIEDKEFRVGERDKKMNKEFYRQNMSLSDLKTPRELLKNKEYLLHKF